MQTAASTPIDARWNRWRDLRGTSSTPIRPPLLRIGVILIFILQGLDMIHGWPKRDNNDGLVPAQV
jgi:hypothetical protein